MSGKQVITITFAQQEQLVEAFKRVPYPDNLRDALQYLSNETGLDTHTIKTWFAARRAEAGGKETISIQFKVGPDLSRLGQEYYNPNTVDEVIESDDDDDDVTIEEASTSTEVSKFSSSCAVIKSELGEDGNLTQEQKASEHDKLKGEVDALQSQLNKMKALESQQQQQQPPSWPQYQQQQPPAPWHSYPSPQQQPGWTLPYPPPDAIWNPPPHPLYAPAYPPHPAFHTYHQAGFQFQHSYHQQRASPLALSAPPIRTLQADVQQKQTIAKLIAIAPNDNEKIKEEPKSPAPTGNDFEDFNKLAENIESSAVTSGEIVLAPYSANEDPLPETSTNNTLDVLTVNDEIVTDTASEPSVVAMKTSEQVEAEDNEGGKKKEVADAAADDVASNPSEVKIRMQSLLGAMRTRMKEQDPVVITDTDSDNSTIKVAESSVNNETERLPSEMLNREKNNQTTEIDTINHPLNETDFGQNESKLCEGSSKTSYEVDEAIQETSDNNFNLEQIEENIITDGSLDISDNMKEKFEEECTDILNKTAIPELPPDMPEMLNSLDKELRENLLQYALLKNQYALRGIQPPAKIKAEPGLDLEEITNQNMNKLKRKSLPTKSISKEYKKPKNDEPLPSTHSLPNPRLLDVSKTAGVPGSETSPKQPLPNIKQKNTIPVPSDLGKPTVPVQRPSQVNTARAAQVATPTLIPRPQPLLLPQNVAANRLNTQTKKRKAEVPVKAVRRKAPKAAVAAPRIVPSELQTPPVVPRIGSGISIQKVKNPLTDPNKSKELTKIMGLPGVSISVSAAPKKFFE